MSLASNALSDPIGPIASRHHYCGLGKNLTRTSGIPAFAKLAPLAVHAPGLFRSPVKGDRDKYVCLKHTLGGIDFEIAGPVLGAGELRVLQALAALAKPTSPVSRAHRAPSAEETMEMLSKLLSQTRPLKTSYSAVARAAGYAGGSSARAAVRAAFKRLAGVTIAATTKTRGLALGHLIQHAVGNENDTLIAHLSPVLTAALLGSHGTYLLVSLDEARRLKSDAARLLHHRLHWLNPGTSRSAGLDKLLTYVYPEPCASSSTHRTRRAEVRRAAQELEAAGWSAMPTGPEGFIISRPALGRIADAPLARSQTPSGLNADASPNA